MRDKVNVFYYPEMVASQSTLKKAILFFDEIHFMDRPSFNFGNFGLIGMPSPLRKYEKSFRTERVPLYVHDAPGGTVEGELYERIAADVNDPLFLARFQEGLKTSKTFRELHITPGNYPEMGSHEDVARKITSIELTTALASYKSAMSLFEDESIRHFNLTTPAGCAKQLIAYAAICSAKLNFALGVSSSYGHVPLADATPYRDLLGAKYARAISKAVAQCNLQVTDLSFAIFDELVLSERLDKIEIKDVIRYRRASESAREEFLEHLGVLQSKHVNIGADGNYAESIDRIVKTEIIPSARAFKAKLQTIEDSLFGSLAKGVLGVAGASAGMSVFGDLSWDKLITLSAGAGVLAGKAAIDAIIAQRGARRECAVSYILSLDK